MNKFILVIIVTLLFFTNPIFVVAVDQMSRGEKLERELWADVKAKDWQAIKSKIAPGFQSVHQDGSRNREQEIKLIKGLNIRSFELSEFKVTEIGPTSIVTYSASVVETIDDKRLSKKPAERLSVWQKTENGWMWIAHANLKPLG